MAVALFYTVLGLSIYWLYRINSTRYESGTFNGKNGNDYPYVIGDNLHFGGDRTTKFHGIDIVLPKALPHIYLDATKNQGLRGPKTFMSADQIIQLEGDFNQYFTAYVIEGAETLALSILTPDVLQTLIDNANGMDVEIYHTHVRIISNIRVYRWPVLKEELYRCAEKLLSEIDHKLQSWTDDDKVEAREQSLKTEDMPSVRLFGRNVRLSTLVITTVWGSLSALLWGMAIHDTLHPDPAAPISGARDEIILALIFFPVIFTFLIIGVPRGWLTRIADFIEKYGSR